jgi:polyphosphate kinase|tara:strand:+ start:5088 stop:7148 length:2061 start_codon:yes stop_codon:yes gene_type:complete
MKEKVPTHWINRDISWLSFNERVLQEAEDPNNPVIERMRFLGIFSNNRDEFFRVRVANIKRVADLTADVKLSTGENPKVVLDKILKVVLKQQVRFDKAYVKLLKELEKDDIYFLNEKQIKGHHVSFIKDFFADKVRTALVPIIIDKKAPFPFLKDAATYMFVKMYNKKDKKSKIEYALLEIPTGSIQRIIALPNILEKQFLIMLDDIIRYNLPQVFSIFKYDTIEAYNVKLTRDAELDIDEDISKSIVDKLSRSIKNRKAGDPVRFVYDAEMPDDMKVLIIRKLKLKKDNLIPGGRYHNFKDFIAFPEVGKSKLRNTPLPPLPNKDLEGSESIMDVLKIKDVMLFYPFQKFDYVIDLLRQAAIDPNVTTIKINIYRVASNSKIINALINAVKNGKDVTVLIELRARFDEQNNIGWSEALEAEGVKVSFGLAGLKIHSKLIMIKRKEGRSENTYVHIGTGNFHENTARIYSDVSLLTSDKRITNEIEKVFEFIERPYLNKRFTNIIVSPFNTRTRFIKLIDKEISNVRKNKKALIIIKLNNLNDPELINKLYEASCEGVTVKLIIRGVCSLVPGVKDLSENIEVISIIDRFLEHVRLFYFYNDGDELFYQGSADWLVRNLDKRVEVTTPIYDKEIKKQVKHFLELQLKDNVKARLINRRGSNKYVVCKGKKVRSQLEQYRYFESMLE